jgi:membrane-anchored protein YejM (alkaline phosphatase superfamily)
VRSWPLELFRANGYAVVGAASSQLSGWGDLSVLTRQFDSFAEFDGKGPAERDRQLADWAERWRREHGAERPYFMVLFFDATHHKYYYPPGFERFRPALPEEHNLVTGKVTDPEVRRGFINRYKNAVGYVDHLVGEVGRALGGDDTIFVVTGDHGEEFWDNGLLGHTAVSFVNARTQTPLVMCTPEHAGRTFPRSSEVDILPSLVAATGLSPPVPPAAYSDGVPLAGADPDRFLLMSGMGFPFTNRQVCVVSPTRKYWLEKERTGGKRFLPTRTTDLDDRDAPPVPGELERAIEWLERTYRVFFTP